MRGMKEAILNTVRKGSSNWIEGDKGEERDSFIKLARPREDHQDLTLNFLVNSN